MAICARCKKEWAGDKLFLTCHECRVPYKPSKRAKHGCKRFGRVNNRCGDRSDPSPGDENGVRLLEDG